MKNNELLQILKRVSKGKTSVRDGACQITAASFEDIGFAKIDHHRSTRCGFPEVIFCPGKTSRQISTIAERILKKSPMVLATRVDKKTVAALKKKFAPVEHNESARTIVIRRKKFTCKKSGLVCVVSAGTSDIPVAEEARVAAECMGANVKTIYDAGVAGIHRLLAYQKELARANVVVVVAGMEGALASVVGGILDKPVIGVPTSIGYGASFGGVAALLAMLNSCASNVCVVNIDNGFGAGYIAGLINKLACKGD